MTIDNLIEAISREIERIWGDTSHGEFKHYEWLEKHYGITEEDDVQWILILMDSIDELPPEEEEDEELMAFLENEEAVYSFLDDLLKKYRSNTLTYPGTG